MGKVWHQLRREGRTLACCTVERLMRQMEVKGGVLAKGAEPPIRFATSLLTGSDVASVLCTSS
ncbi:hypothetical protein [Acetobacter orientalis]|uniref:hypothetical protein n=1 Tax=Acetobacter orientalis TaxID=146474 RepID=UPI0039E9D357